MCSRSCPRTSHGDGVINIDDLQWEYLEGDGDFRSAEVTALRDEADIVITNPPFSLFREFMAWLVEGGTKFAIIGNQNAITYKEIFPLIQEQPNVARQGIPSQHGPLSIRLTRRTAEVDRAGGRDVVRVARRSMVHQHRARATARAAAAHDDG